MVWRQVIDDTYSQPVSPSDVEPIAKQVRLRKSPHQHRRARTHHPPVPPILSKKRRAHNPDTDTDFHSRHTDDSDDNSKTPEQPPTWVRSTVRSRVPVRSSRRPPRYDNLLPSSSGGASKDARHQNGTSAPHRRRRRRAISSACRTSITNDACAPQVEKQEKKKTPQGPREEACHVHPPLRKRRHDRRQAQDEPQPDLLNCQPRVEPVAAHGK
ncbi:hypothetical protein Q7P37_011336 [Cladosporium fusiforme]